MFYILALAPEPETARSLGRLGQHFSRRAASQRLPSDQAAQPVA